MLIQRVEILCDSVLHITIEQLEHIISHIENFYGEYPKYKKDKLGNRRINKPKYRKKFGYYWSRTINPPNDELKSIQKRINGYINNHIPMPEYAFGGVKGKDNIQNAKLHKGQKYVFQTDLTDFYPYITNKMVYKMFVDKGFSADIASILTKLTTYNGHLPQGAPTSTTIANLVFEPTGLKLHRLAIDNSLRFSTFVDDVTMSSQNQFKELTPEIIRILREGGFRISQNKTTYKSGITEVTGVRLLNNSMTTTKKFKEKYDNKETLSAAAVKGMEQYKSRIKALAGE